MLGKLCFKSCGTVALVTEPRKRKRFLRYNGKNAAYQEPRRKYEANKAFCERGRLEIRNNTDYSVIDNRLFFFLTSLTHGCYDTKQDKGDDEEEYVTAVFREGAAGASA